MTGSCNVRACTSRPLVDRSFFSLMSLTRRTKKFTQEQLSQAKERETKWCYLPEKGGAVLSQREEKSRGQRMRKKNRLRKKEASSSPSTQEEQGISTSLAVSGGNWDAFLREKGIPVNDTLGQIAASDFCVQRTLERPFSPIHLMGEFFAQFSFAPLLLHLNSYSKWSG